MASPDIPQRSPKLSDKLTVAVSMPSLPFRHGERSPLPPSLSEVSAYENYLRLPELRGLWSSRDFPNWKGEPILKPALQALEITFRFVSTVLSDPRPYLNRREWGRKLESLAMRQIELIAGLCDCEDEDDETPVDDSRSSEGVALTRESSATEVWKLSERTTVVSRQSDQSLLPRLASWRKSEGIAQKILYSIECEMRGCPYTLGLGEPNLAGKPCLRYDAVCKPSDLHSLRKSPSEQLQLDNHENQTLYTAHQILESWVQASRKLLARIVERIEARNFERASADCWMLERIWKLLAEIEDVHLLMDPDDFLRLKSQLSIKSASDTEAFYFRSEGLMRITKLSKELKHRLPWILEVEVDPKGGPRIQEAAMKLYRERRGCERIHLLQGLQTIESAMKRFFFAYRQVVVTMMGSVEARANRALVSTESCDSLSQLFLEPTYFPSLDAAKTFLGDNWEYQTGSAQPRRRRTEHRGV